VPERPEVPAAGELNGSQPDESGGEFVAVGPHRLLTIGVGVRFIATDELARMRVGAADIIQVNNGAAVGVVLDAADRERTVTAKTVAM
jgi:hypothetical protein